MFLVHFFYVHSFHLCLWLTQEWHKKTFEQKARACNIAFFCMHVFVWIFVLVISIVLFWVGESYVAGIGGRFVASFVLFIIALIFSVVVLQETKE